MGIFQKKASDLGSMFGRQKKGKMTLKDNEDEQSLVDFLPSTKKTTARKIPRKNKIKTKFRRLQEEWEDSGTPEYEPPKGFELPEHDPHSAQIGRKQEETTVPKNIGFCYSISDTVSTLEESIFDAVDVYQKKEKKDRPIILLPIKKSTTQSGDSSHARMLDYQDRSVGNILDNTNDQKENEVKALTVKNPKKAVEPKFYPLGEVPSTDINSPFEIPSFDGPPSRKDRETIQFTCSEEYEKDDHVEKVSSVGSNDFHQFIVKKMPSKSPTAPISERDTTMKKAAESIAASLSSPVPQKFRNRMVPNTSPPKRPRSALDEGKPLQQSNSGPTPHHEPTHCSATAQAASDPAHMTSSNIVAPSYSNDSAAISDQNAVLFGTETEDHEEVPRDDSSDPFDIGSYSESCNSFDCSHEEKTNEFHHKQVAEMEETHHDLIDIIRIASKRSDEEASRKPDPSPSYSVNHHLEAKISQDDSSTEPCIDEDIDDHIPHSKSYASGRSGALSNPSGVPTNAILGSMLFRSAHSESTLSLAQETPDSFFDDEYSVPGKVGMETMELETVSSVTEDAGSFYHENFERWNNRAHRAINKLYDTYHSASTNLMRGTRTTSGQSSLFEA